MSISVNIRGVGFVRGLSQILIPCLPWYQWCWERIKGGSIKSFISPSAPAGHENPQIEVILAAQRWTWVIGHVCRGIYRFLNCEIAWLSLCFILETSWVALYSVVCQSVCEVSVTPDQISTFSNIYRHTSPLLTMYHLIPSSTNLYWPSTSQYHHILTQYHQVPLI